MRASRTRLSALAALATGVAAALLLTGCTAPSGGTPRLSASACSAAEALFAGPKPAFEDDGTPTDDPSRFSEPTIAALRAEVPDALAADLGAVVAAEADPTVDIEEPAARLQEWAIRGCGIDVAFAHEDDPVPPAASTDITVGGEAGVVIVSTRGPEHALQLCTEAVTAGAAEVTVADGYGVPLAAADGEGSCVLVLQPGG